MPPKKGVRCSARLIEKSFMEKEIVTKRHDDVLEFVILPNYAKKNVLNIQAIKELIQAFKLAKNDDSCKAVIISSTGNYFCTGIDHSMLVGCSKEFAKELISKICELVETMKSFFKPVVAAVNGISADFGVSLAIMCDFIIASDKAIFYTNSMQLGHIQVGAIYMLLPQIMRSDVAYEMLLTGRKVTADEAYHLKLVWDVWPYSCYFMMKVFNRLALILYFSSKLMKQKKIAYNEDWKILKKHLEEECIAWPQLWRKASTQRYIKKFLETSSLAGLD